MRTPTAAVLLLSAVHAAAQTTAAPPTLRAQPVTDDYHGTKVEDRFRFIEKMEPATMAWMRAQAARTRRTLDSIAPRAALQARMAAFGGSFGFAYSAEYAGDRLFFSERAPNTEQGSLVVRERDGRRRVLVDVPAMIAAKGYPVAIDGFEPSRDGRFVALRMSEKGSESSQLTILDVATGKTIAGPVRMGPFTGTSWDVDGKSLFFTRMPDPATVAVADRYKNAEILYWTFGQEPRVVVGAKQGLGPNDNPAHFPAMFKPRGTDRAILMIADGVSNEFRAWEAPRRDAAAGTAKWRQIVTLEDAVTGFYAAPDGITFLTHRDAPGFKVTRTSWTGTAAEATLLLPPREGVFYDSLRGGRDAVYVAGRERLGGALWRVASAAAPERLRLPVQGTIDSIEAESDRDGAIVALSGFATPTTHFAYRPGAGFTDLRLERRPAGLDLSRYRVVETDATARDGAKVPLVVLSAAGPRRPRPFLLDAYGAYGVSNLPYFAPRLLVGADAGLGYASCSVRGGGELGEEWRLAGKDANKPNTWRDAIACAEKLIADGYTTRAQLAIMGTSAGGIMVGRAVEERPDLFAAGISAVGVANPLRMEETPGGAANANEYGSVKDAAGFRNLLAMDAYQNVKDGVKLPPFLVTTGLEDPRVVPWQPAKFVARLQEAGDTAFLRVEEKAGHGMGSTRSARDAEQADIAAFILWHAGLPAWQPTAR